MPNDAMSYEPQSARELETHLRRRLHGQLQDVHLEVDDGGVILRGRAPSFYVKQLAQHLVMRLTKLRIRANEIEVPIMQTVG